MQEPSVKLREDVEAEWLPKVQKLEARAKERETFYKSLYDSVLELKSQKAQLKEVSREHSQSHPLTPVLSDVKNSKVFVTNTLPSMSHHAKTALSMIRRQASPLHHRVARPS